jgi:transposase
MMKVPTPRSSTAPGTDVAAYVAACPDRGRHDHPNRGARVRIVDAAVAGETTVLWCELLSDGPGRCPGCGITGTYRDTSERRVSDVPGVGYPLELRVRVPRYRCVHDGCAREVFVHDTSRLARPGASTTRRCARFILRRLMLDKASGPAAPFNAVALPWRP